MNSVFNPTINNAIFANSVIGLTVICALLGCGNDTNIGPAKNDSPIQGVWHSNAGDMELRGNDSVIVITTGKPLQITARSRWFVYNNNTILSQILENEYQSLLLQLANDPISYGGSNWSASLVTNQIVAYSMRFTGDSLCINNGKSFSNCFTR